jgi:formylmethanofuran dehydrogenase subunit E
MPTQTRDTPRIQTLTMCSKCGKGFPVKEMYPDGAHRYICKGCAGASDAR